LARRPDVGRSHEPDKTTKLAPQALVLIDMYSDVGQNYSAKTTHSKESRP
jgi:hypothetical protein